MADDFSELFKFKIWLRWQKKALFMLWMRLWGYNFKKRGKRLLCLGRRSYFKKNSITVGDYVFINRDVHLGANVQIGHFVQVAADVAIVGGDHRTDLVGVPMTFTYREDVEQLLTVIEDDVWIGHGAIIMAGVKIGRGAIVAAGSVVAKDVPPYAIVGGAPAKFIRLRFNEEQQQIHNKSLDMLIKSKNPEFESYRLIKQILSQKKEGDDSALQQNAEV